MPHAFNPEDHLPAHVAERLTLIADRPVPAGGQFVLYWLRVAMRDHENPALDVALCAARALGLPLLVYQALDERYPYASDRIHRFILEGARELGEGLARRRIRHLFHLERRIDLDGPLRPVLRDLAGRAAVLVIEDFPVEPFRGLAQRLAGGLDCPVWAVDASCVVPMPLIDRGHERAFAFRKAMMPFLAARLEREWPEQPDPEGLAPIPDDLGFQPVDLGRADLSALIAGSAIDHSVAPVPDTPGGMRAAAQRWTDFRDNRLRAYADRRNDAKDRDGVSRMSAYLHFGMISPLRVARETAARSSPGSEKYLDELLVWRELAWNFCWHRRDQDTLAALPNWARATLRTHVEDPRPDLYDWETLARGRTGHGLWDAAQRSLLIHGELHNNLRMSWGKALLHWTRDPEEALATLIDLNHRFALDGRDPASYGGLLWCMGQFDRPFTPEQPVIGTVRPRPLEGHARRLSVPALVARIERSGLPNPPRVAVIGAGLAGLAAARTLLDAGLAPVVFDKGRGPGGRISTRRLADLGHGVSVDHGAPSFSAPSDPGFGRLVMAWQRQGLLAPWDGGARGFTAIPSMSALARHMASDLDVRAGVEVAPLDPTEREGGWLLRDREGRELGAFEAVLLTAPPPQTAALTDAAAPSLAELASRVAMRPSWVGWVATDRELDPTDLAEFDPAIISSIWLEGGKPGRSGHAIARIEAAEAWTNAHLEEPRETVAEALRAAVPGLCGGAGGAVLLCQAHRWRFARVAPGQTLPAPDFDPALGLGWAGDWTAPPNDAACDIERAFLAGQAAAGVLLNRLLQRDIVEALVPTGL